TTHVSPGASPTSPTPGREREKVTTSPPGETDTDPTPPVVAATNLSGGGRASTIVTLYAVSEFASALRSVRVKVIALAELPVGGPVFSSVRCGVRTSTVTGADVRRGCTRPMPLSNAATAAVGPIHGPSPVTVTVKLRDPDAPGASVPSEKLYSGNVDATPAGTE